MNTQYKEYITKRKTKDNLNKTIPRGTRVLILKELINPMTKLKEFIIAIDNGTGLNELYPKAVITYGALNRAIEGVTEHGC